MFKIVNIFRLGKLGVGVVLDGPTTLPIGRPLNALVTTRDGETLEFVAWKEFIRDLTHPLGERVAFRLQGLDDAKLSVGDAITFSD